MNSPSDRKQYYDRIFEMHLDEEWNRAPGKDVLINALKHEYAKRRLGGSERLIDLGCGTGFLLNRIHSEVCDSWELVGVDFSSAAIERGKDLYPHLHLFCEDATATHFPDQFFSVLVSYGSIEHFPDPADALKEATRLLQPKGLFLLMLPTLGVYRTDKHDEGWYEDLTGQPQWNLRRDTWESYFTQYGLGLWDIDLAQRFGALKPGVFYLGRKHPR